jgi:serine/threonine protein kinase
MRVLFVIPKAEQPLLQGNFSSAFKDFVACCTQRDPLARASAAQLLKHSFLKACSCPGSKLVHVGDHGIMGCAHPYLKDLFAPKVEVNGFDTLPGLWNQGFVL